MQLYTILASILTWHQSVRISYPKSEDCYTSSCPCRLSPWRQRMTRVLHCHWSTGAECSKRRVPLLAVDSGRRRTVTEAWRTCQWPASSAFKTKWEVFLVTPTLWKYFNVLHLFCFYIFCVRLLLISCTLMSVSATGPDMSLLVHTEVHFILILLGFIRVLFHMYVLANKINK